MHRSYVVLICLLMSFCYLYSQSDSSSDSCDSASRSLKITITPSTSLEKVCTTEKLPSHGSINMPEHEEVLVSPFLKQRRNGCARFFVAACRFLTCCCD